MAIFKLILISKFLGAMYVLNIDFLRDERKIYKNFSCKLHIIVMILMIGFNDYVRKFNFYYYSKIIIHYVSCKISVEN